MGRWSAGWVVLAGMACAEDVDQGDGGDTVAIDTGLDDTVIDTGTVPIITTNPTGGSQTCLRVGGGNDRVRASAVGTPTGASPQTLEAWVRTASLHAQVAVSQGLASPGKALYLGTDDGFLMTSAAGLPFVDDQLFVADGEWHHIAVTYNGREATVTMDGQRGASFDLEDVDVLEGEVVAGAAPTTGGHAWVGWIDDVKLFARERTIGDLAEPSVHDDRGLVLWWDFEVEGEGPGVSVPDQSGAGLDGLSGGTEGTPAFLPCR